MYVHVEMCRKISIPPHLLFTTLLQVILIDVFIALGVSRNTFMFYFKFLFEQLKKLCNPEMKTENKDKKNLCRRP